jgi:hypothetical protein
MCLAQASVSCARYSHPNSSAPVTTVFLSAAATHLWHRIIIVADATYVRYQQNSQFFADGISEVLAG